MTDDVPKLDVRDSDAIAEELRAGIRAGVVFTGFGSGPDTRRGRGALRRGADRATEPGAVQK